MVIAQFIQQKSYQEENQEHIINHSWPNIKLKDRLRFRWH